MSVIESFPLGDFAVSWKVADSISSESTRRVLACYRALQNCNEPFTAAVNDTVPTYLSVTVYFKETVAEIGNVIRCVDSFLRQLDIDSLAEKEKSGTGEVTVIPVDYSGPDLERVARLHGMTVGQVIKRHSEVDYQVAMIGFKPHFPYLIGLPEDLETPRLETPRTSVPAGAVAIGGAQTGIYPEVSPGGWNLLGMTDPELLKLLNPGDRIRFRPVNRDKGESLCL